MALLVLTPQLEESMEEDMLSVHVDNVDEMAIIECAGRIVRSEAALKLREAVNAQSDSRIIVLDLSEVPAIEGGGLGMLLFLQRWASNHDIRLKLFNPRQSVRDRLEHVNSMREFEIATIDELMALLTRADRRRSASAARENQHEAVMEFNKPDTHIDGEAQSASLTQWVPFYIVLRPSAVPF